MSLVCYECQRDMGPSETLPGREGTFVHPMVQSLVYVPAGDGISYELAYMEAPDNLALCFNCLEGKMPESRKQVLKSVYTAYDLETDYMRIEEQQKGKWLGAKDMKLSLNAHERFEKALEALKPECLFCGDDPKNGKPFFLARAIERAYSSKHLAGLGSDNYSFSNIKTGSVSFEICLDDFRNNFRRTFEQLSYSMLGKRNPNQKAKANELYISPKVEKAFEHETGQSFDDFINQIAKSGTGNLRIVRREKED